MDLNELLHAHQLEVMKASASPDGQTRQGHFEKIAIYARRIRELRQIRTPGASPSAEETPETIIYGSYAGETAPAVPNATLESWESEGGAIYPPLVPPPPEITTRIVREYQVGPYVYHDLSLAMAEYERQKGRMPQERPLHG